jgi:cytochrome b6-f complex subunit 5
MVEPLLSGIVLGMITVTAFGLFVAAFLQYRRGNQSLIFVKILQIKNL